MAQRIAPNNTLPATHFIEVSKDDIGLWYKCLLPIERLDYEIKYSEMDLNTKVIGIFRIRENKLPTKHNFNK